MHGQTVCRMHGGSAPQALAKAEERLLALEHPAIDAVKHIINHGDTDAVRFAAARYILELLGHKVAQQQQVEGRVVIEVELVDRAAPVPHALTNGVVDIGDAADSAT